MLSSTALLFGSGVDNTLTLHVHNHNFVPRQWRASLSYFPRRPSTTWIDIDSNPYSVVSSRHKYGFTSPQTSGEDQTCPCEPPTMFSRTPTAADHHPPVVQPGSEDVDALTFPPHQALQLEPYLPPPPPPPPTRNHYDDRPYVTLTYAQSLDSQIAARPGARTLLSGPESKAMTHFLRSRHGAILVGAGTAAADDPGLNCRLRGGGGGEGQGQGKQQQQQQHHPRPVVLDPRARWAVGEGSKVVRLARQGKGLGPWVLHAEGVVPAAERVAAVEGCGGAYVSVPTEGEGWAQQTAGEGKGGGAAAAAAATPPPVVLTWTSVLRTLRARGVDSVMVEGGGRVIDDLLGLAHGGADVVNAVVVTIAPRWLGRGGVSVAPGRPVGVEDDDGEDGGEGEAKGTLLGPGPRLGDVRWLQMGVDMVLCGRIARDE